MTRGIALGLVITAFLAVAATTAAADTIDYASRAAFDAANPTAVVENWDGFTAGTTFTNGSTANGITYNSSTNISVVTSLFLTTTGPNGLGRTPIEYFGTSDTITFGFSQGATAFGIDINTFSTTSGAYRAVTDTGEVVLSAYNPFPGAGTGQFVGFAADAVFYSVTIGVTPGSGGGTYTLDTLRYNPVPEPASLALMGLGLAGFAAARRRSRCS